MKGLRGAATPRTWEKLLLDVLFGVLFVQESLTAHAVRQQQQLVRLGELALRQLGAPDVVGSLEALVCAQAKGREQRRHVVRAPGRDVGGDHVCARLGGGKLAGLGWEPRVSAQGKRSARRRGRTSKASS